jgi:hypothetical protein
MSFLLWEISIIKCTGVNQSSVIYTEDYDVTWDVLLNEVPHKLQPYLYQEMCSCVIAYCYVMRCFTRCALRLGYIPRPAVLGLGGGG